MRRTTNRTITGILWGVGVGLVFGPIPAFAMVFGILEDWLDSSSDERTAFALLWGACALFLTLLGGAIGYVSGRGSPPE